ATVDGKLDAAGAAGKPAFTGDARIEAPDLGRAVEQITAALGSAAASPVAPGQAMVLTTAVAGSPEADKLDDLVLALGESRLQCSVAPDLGWMPAIDLKLTGNRLDLDALLAPAADAAPAPSGAPTPAAPGGPAAAGAQDIALPAGIGASVDLAIDAVQY